MTVLVFIGSLLGSMAIGMPIAFALLVCSVALMLFMGLFESQVIAQNLINGADSFPLLAVPFFILAGEIMNVGGLAKRIVNVALTLVGHVRGGLGYVTIMAAVVLASLSGSAVADAAALATLLMPMMVAAGHNRASSAGLIASAGIIAPVIPPSIAFVIFGVASGVSIKKLFLAGIVPGMLLGLALVIAWWWVSRKDQVEILQTRKSAGEVGRALYRRHLGADAARNHRLWPALWHLYPDRGRRGRRRLLVLRGNGDLPRAQMGADLSRCWFRRALTTASRGVPGRGSHGIGLADHADRRSPCRSPIWWSRSSATRRCF